MKNLASGIGQVCLHLGHELVRQCPPDWDLTFMVPRELVGVFGPSANYVVAKRWRQFIKPRGYDVWHCLYQSSRYLPTHTTPLVYTILDLNYLLLPNYSDRQKQRQKNRYQHCIDRASVITTISDYVANDVRQQLVVPATTPVQVIYCGVDVPTPESIPKRVFCPENPFLFFVGAINPRKNIHTLLPILTANPQYTLVLAGPDDHPYANEVRQQAEQLGVSDRLLMPGTIDEATKWWLYAHCEAFLFPSLLEGFGLPLIEAMAFGKPVFSSDRMSLPEVGGSDAFYFDSFGADAMVDTFRRGMETYHKDPTMPDRLRARSQLFRWEAIAAAYWQLYKQLATGDTH